MSTEIQLISEIEKRPCLYNFNLQEYNRKEVLDEAWTDVAANCNSTVHECKDKWKNIRSSFLRSLKQSTGKPKKPYYMTTFLQFIVPFLKPAANVAINADDSQLEYDSNDNTSGSDHTLTIKVEPLNELEAEQMEYQSTNILSTEAIRPNLPVRPSIMRRKSRPIPSSMKSYTDYIRHKKQKATILTATTAVARVENNALRYFMLSLLPEFDTMTDDEIRMFKIKVMILIDDIKANYPDMKESMYSGNNERLQKRLINLLLSNLEGSSNNSTDNHTNSKKYELNQL